MNGTVLVAIVEGVVIGAGYVVAGVPKPYLFAILTAAFAMVPLGAWVVFTSAALVLAAQGGAPAAAFGVFAFGALVDDRGRHLDLACAGRKPGTAAVPDCAGRDPGRRADVRADRLVCRARHPRGILDCGPRLGVAIRTARSELTRAGPAVRERVFNVP